MCRWAGCSRRGLRAPREMAGSRRWMGVGRSRRGRRLQNRRRLDLKQRRPGGGWIGVGGDAWLRRVHEGASEPAEASDPGEGVGGGSGRGWSAAAGDGAYRTGGGWILDGSLRDRCTLPSQARCSAGESSLPEMARYGRKSASHLLLVWKDRESQRCDALPQQMRCSAGESSLPEIARYGRISALRLEHHL